MDGPTKPPVAFDLLPANRDLIEALFSQGVLTQQARARALDLVTPPAAWALWSARMLTAVGVSLVLSGVIYFFAYNWAELTSAMKLGSIELIMAVCLAGAVILGLSRASGQTLLLCASVLVGVFWAVFGQIYQTGADAYVLFLAWAAMTLGFALIGNFAPLWAVWLAVANTFLVLYWQQAVIPGPGMEEWIFGVVAMFNLCFLILREFLAAQGVAWLANRWTRGLLVVTVLGATIWPMTVLIVGGRHEVSPSLIQSAAIGYILLATFVWFYRFKAPDMFALGVSVLAVSVVAECVVFRVVRDVVGHNGSGEVGLALMTVSTLALFATLVAVLRAVSRNMGVADGR